MIARRARLVRSVAAATVLVAAVAVAAVRPLAAGHSFLWKVTKGERTVYLVGSVHVLAQDYYPLSPALEAAYKDSDQLVEEVDLAEMLSPDAQMRLLSRGMLPGEQTLDKVISPAAFKAIGERITALGLPVEPLLRFKPWSIAITVTTIEWQRAGFDASLGLDMHFYNRAVTDGRPVRGLETVDYQLSLFDAMSIAQQERFLTESLKELDTERSNVVAVAQAWKNGDAATIEKFALQDMKDDPALYDRLLVQRNRNWMPTLEALFGRQTRTLVVVGAEHLVGKDGLLAMLAAKGYQLEQQ